MPTGKHRLPSRPNPARQGARHGLWAFALASLLVLLPIGSSLALTSSKSPTARTCTTSKAGKEHSKSGGRCSMPPHSWHTKKPRPPHHHGSRTPAPTPTASPDGTDLPTPKPTVSDTPKSTPTISLPSPTLTPTVTPTPSPTATPTPTHTATPTPTHSPTPTVTPTVTQTPTYSPTPTVTPTVTPTTSAPSPTQTPTTGPTASPEPPAGFPDETNTGVPAGTTLRNVPGDVRSGPGWHYDDRGWVVIDGNGATFSGYRVNVDVSVEANNVTIRGNSLTSTNWPIALRHTTGVVIDRNDISGPATRYCDNAIRGIYSDDDQVTITRNDISHCASGINHLQAGGLIQANFIHDIGFPCSGSACLHYNGIQLGAGTGPLMTIDGNTILVTQDQTDAIMLANDEGAQRNRVITGNFLAGGGYSFYGSGGPSGSATGIVFRNNQFSTMYFPRSGYWGPVAHWKAGNGNVWEGNTWADGPRVGQSVTP